MKKDKNVYQNDEINKIEQQNDKINKNKQKSDENDEINSKVAKVNMLIKVEGHWRPLRKNL